MPRAGAGGHGGASNGEGGGRTLARPRSPRLDVDDGRDGRRRRVRPPPLRGVGDQCVAVGEGATDHCAVLAGGRDERIMLAGRACPRCVRGRSDRGVIAGRGSGGHRALAPRQAGRAWRRRWERRRGSWERGLGRSRLAAAPAGAPRPRRRRMRGSGGPRAPAHGRAERVGRSRRGGGPGSRECGRQRSCVAAMPTGRRRPKTIPRVPCPRPRRAAASWPSRGLGLVPGDDPGLSLRWCRRRGGHWGRACGGREGVGRRREQRPGRGGGDDLRGVVGEHPGKADVRGNGARADIPGGAPVAAPAAGQRAGAVPVEGDEGGRGRGRPGLRRRGVVAAGEGGQTGQGRRCRRHTVRPEGHARFNGEGPGGRPGPCLADRTPSEEVEEGEGWCNHIRTLTPYAQQS